jgi:hypothetical protein
MRVYVARALHSQRLAVPVLAYARVVFETVRPSCAHEWAARALERVEIVEDTRAKGSTLAPRRGRGGGTPLALVLEWPRE